MNNTSYRSSYLNILLQAHKFYGVQDQIARDCFETIKSSNSPEKAAIIGRKLQKQRPDLVYFENNTFNTSIKLVNSTNSKKEIVHSAVICF